VVAVDISTRGKEEEAEEEEPGTTASRRNFDLAERPGGELPNTSGEKATRKETMKKDLCGVTYRYRCLAVRLPADNIPSIYLLQLLYAKNNLEKENMFKLPDYHYLLAALIRDFDM
jgi:hypothetical protein